MNSPLQHTPGTLVVDFVAQIIDSVQVTKRRCTRGEGAAAAQSEGAVGGVAGGPVTATDAAGAAASSLKEAAIGLLASDAEGLQKVEQRAADEGTGGFRIAVGPILDDLAPDLDRGQDGDDDKTEGEHIVGAAVEVLVRGVLEMAKDLSPKALIKGTNIFEAAPRVLKGLFSRDGAAMQSGELSAKDKDGYASIHWAAECGHEDVVSLLLQLGTDPNLSGPSSKPALALAAEWDRIAVVKVLLAAGAKVEVSDKLKRTPLLLAVRTGAAPAASILLRHGADPDAKDSSGNTCAHYASAFGFVECIRLLHKAEADFSRPNDMKLTPLVAGAKKGHRIIVRELMENCKVGSSACSCKII